MESAKTHRTTAELEQGLSHVLASPKETGVLEGVFVRPSANERRQLDIATLSPAGGLEGDRWATAHWQKLPDGRPDPQSQVSLINARVLRLVADDDEALGLAGDNLVIDLDLTEENVPAESRLRIGAEVVLEITAQPHTGCGKFSRRFGKQALDFINGPVGAPLKLRGRFARIIKGGTIRAGDAVCRM